MKYTNFRVQMEKIPKLIDSLKNDNLGWGIYIFFNEGKKEKYIAFSEKDERQAKKIYVVLKEFIKFLEDKMISKKEVKGPRFINNNFNYDE